MNETTVHALLVAHGLGEEDEIFNIIRSLPILESCRAEFYARVCDYDEPLTKHQLQRIYNRSLLEGTLAASKE